MSLDTELSDLEALVYSATFHVTSPVTADDIYEAILNYFKDVCNEIIGPDDDIETYFSDNRQWEVPEPEEARIRNELRAAQRERLQRVVGNVSPPIPKKENNEVDK